MVGTLQFSMEPLATFRKPMWRFERLFSFLIHAQKVAPTASTAPPPPKATVPFGVLFDTAETPSCPSKQRQAFTDEARSRLFYIFMKMLTQRALMTYCLFLCFFLLMTRCRR
jgi:hypothetical protein